MAPSPHQPLRCLVVDDDPISARALALVVKTVAQVDIAVDGRQAILDVERAVVHNQPYAVILMDIYMPGIDGLSAIRAIRTMEESRANIRQSRIIITSVARSAQLIQNQVGGMVDAYLVKPVDRRLLMKRLQEWGLINHVPANKAAEASTVNVRRNDGT